MIGHRDVEGNDVRVCAWGGDVEGRDLNRLRRWSERSQWDGLCSVVQIERRTGTLRLRRVRVRSLARRKVVEFDRFFPREIGLSVDVAIRDGDRRTAGRDRLCVRVAGRLGVRDGLISGRSAEFHCVSGGTLDQFTCVCVARAVCQRVKRNSNVVVVDLYRHRR